MTGKEAVIIDKAAAITGKGTIITDTGNDHHWQREATDLQKNGLACISHDKSIRISDTEPADTDIAKMDR